MLAQWKYLTHQLSVLLLAFRLVLELMCGCRESSNLAETSRLIHAIQIVVFIFNARRLCHFRKKIKIFI